MKLSKLTEKVKIDREIDAPEVDIRDLLGVTFTIYKFRLKSYKGHTNWVQCLIGTKVKLPLKKDRRNNRDDGLPRPTGKMRLIGVREDKKKNKEYAYEFHGDFQGLIAYFKALIELHPEDPDWFMPIEDAEIEKNGEYIFKGSTNRIKYINKEEYVKPG